MDVPRMPLCADCPWRPLLVVALLSALQPAATTIVSTLNGDIRGFSTNISGTMVDAYLGVPFARPPLGDLRFKAPQPVQNWTGVFDATKQPNSCIQSLDTSFGRFEGVDMWNTRTNLSEDCLYLNLWVPRSSDGDLLTTMVWIYGGSFVYGSITLDVYDGSQLAASGGVIVAAMQYRMSAHGFLYLDTEEAPGNMGLLDQQLAMKWLHDNAHVFGGDPSKMNLFGESSGAASVGHHLLAPSSWPYFNNAIMQSSTSLSSWAFVSPQDLIQKTLNLAELLNCRKETVEKVAECLRSLDPWEIENKQWELNNGNIGTFVPTLDGSFLTDTPENLISSGKYKDADILLGDTKDEGEYFLIYFYPTVYPPGGIWSTPTVNRSEYLATVTSITGYPESLERDAVLYTYEYSNIPSERGSYTDILDDILGDVLFKCSVRDVARLHSRQSPRKGATYLYEFGYRGSDNPWPGWMGALHGYEIGSVFGGPLRHGANSTAADRHVSDITIAYFTNFAKSGNPNGVMLPTWPEFTEGSEPYLCLACDPGTVVRHGFRARECAFWEYLAPKLERSTAVSGNDVTTSASSMATITSVGAALIIIRHMCIP